MNEFTGRPLTVLLRTKMRHENLTVEQLAKRLQVGHSYLSQLSGGTKPLASVSDKFLRACGEYLEMPVVLVYLLAGRLQAKDFFISPMNLGNQINIALQHIGNSNAAAETSVDTEMLLRLQDEVKLLLVLLYERAEGIALLQTRVGHGEIDAMGQSRMPFEVRLHKPG